MVAAAAGRSALPADDGAATRRHRAFGGRLPEDEGPLTLAQSINRTLTDELAARPQMLVFGEDVARKGGVYGVTRGLLAAFGAGRVFDTLLDEQSILGLALGAGLAGLLPVPEIQYLAYLHNAADQIRGEAATLSFFSAGQYRNPMVVRIAGLGYQKGFGGHFHNDNGVAALRDIPGLVDRLPGHGRTTPRRCCGPAWPPPRRTAASAPSWSRSRSTTPGTCMAAGDGGWLAGVRPAGDCGRPATCRSAGPAPMATAPT